MWQIAADIGHVFGRFVTGGRGNEGQLGLGDYRPRTVPALLKTLGDPSTGTTVLQVACGGAHTLALCDSGDVYAWGSNDEMQLGLGSTFGRKVNRPELVAELCNKGVLRIAAGMICLRRSIPHAQSNFASSM